MRSDIEDDVKIIAGNNETNEAPDQQYWIRRYSAIYRHARKSIIQSQIHLINIAIKIVQLVGAGKDFKVAYMQRFTTYEKSDPDFIQNRCKLRSYLKNLYVGFGLRMAES